MVKLIGVYNGVKDSSKERRVCLVKRQLPIKIEENLTFIVGLDDACIACAPIKNQSSFSVEREQFVKKNRAMTSEEIGGALNVNFEEFMTSLSAEVGCITCRKSVEALLHRIKTLSSLYRLGHSPLEPLIISESGHLSIASDHIFCPQALANLFCLQVPRLQANYLDTTFNKKTGAAARCSIHAPGLGNKGPKFIGRRWLDTWEGMGRECQEEVVLIPFQLLRDTLDRYMKKHGMCTDCSTMVNKAYNILIGEEDKSQEDASDSHGCDDCERSNEFIGVIACTESRHVHIDCSTEYLVMLIEMAEPVLNGKKDESHAKSMKIAKKKILTCIGICLYERLERIQKSLDEGQQTCDLLFLVALKSLRKSFEVSYQIKHGDNDMESLLREFEDEDSKREAKLAKKRENKKLKLKAKKKTKEEQPLGAEEPSIPVLSQPPASAATPEAACLAGPNLEAFKEVSNEMVKTPNKKNKKAPKRKPQTNPCASKHFRSNSTVETCVQETRESTPEVHPGAYKPTIFAGPARLTCFTQGCRKTKPPKSGETFSLLSLKQWLEEDDCGGKGCSFLTGTDQMPLGTGNEEDDVTIPFEDIRNFQANHTYVSQQREELRKHLKRQFEEFCCNRI